MGGFVERMTLWYSRFRKTFNNFKNTTLCSKIERRKHRGVWWRNILETLISICSVVLRLNREISFFFYSKLECIHVLDISYAYNHVCMHNVTLNCALIFISCRLKQLQISILCKTTQAFSREEIWNKYVANILRLFSCNVTVKTGNIQCLQFVQLTFEI